jgi:hypothetical protein
MSFTLDYFKNWASTYTTWTALKDYITSEAGGNLRVIEDAERGEAIIRYDKKVSDLSRPEVRWCRSVIWNTVTNRPLSVMPPKGMDMTGDMMAMTEMPAGWTVDEYYEGTTLALYNNSDERRIASRTKFDATGGFYSKRSFAELYAECNFELVPGTNAFMSVLIQHPEHRVVGQVANAKSYLLHTGTVADDGAITISESIKTTTVPANFDGKPLVNWFADEVTKRGWEWQGIVIKDGKGTRYRLRSNTYRMVRSLRGETPRADERFFSLRRQGLIKTYLYYYPEDKQRYWDYENWLRDATEELYKTYCVVYKEHSMQLEAVSKKWHVHLAGLHGQYMQTLRPAKKTVNRDVVKDYMNGLPTPRLLFLMNLEKRTMPLKPTAAVPLATSPQERRTTTQAIAISGNV